MLRLMSALPCHLRCSAGRREGKFSEGRGVDKGGITLSPVLVYRQTDTGPAGRQGPAIFAALQALRPGLCRGQWGDRRQALPLCGAGGYQTAMSRALLQLAHGSQQAVAWMIMCSIPVSTVYIFSLGNQSSSRQPIVRNSTWHGTICSPHPLCVQTQSCLKQSAVARRVPSLPCRQYHLLTMCPSRIDDVCCDPAAGTLPSI